MKRKEGEPIGWVGEGGRWWSDCHIFSLSLSLLRFGSDGSHSKPRERESYAIAYNLWKLGTSECSRRREPRKERENPVGVEERTMVRSVHLCGAPPNASFPSRFFFSFTVLFLFTRPTNEMLLLQQPMEEPLLVGLVGWWGRFCASPWCYMRPAAPERLWGGNEEREDHELYSMVVV